MSFIYKTQDVESQYQKLLNTQKDLIKNNRYVRELEQRYHRPIRRYPKSQVPNQHSKALKTHHWPIESSMFTKILKQKLNSVFTPPGSASLSISKPKFSRPNTRGQMMPKTGSRNAMASNFSQNVDLSGLKKMIIPKHANDSPFSRPSITNSLDYAEEELRDLNGIRIPRYY